jgi:hypothetical protein
MTQLPPLVVVDPTVPLPPTGSVADVPPRTAPTHHPQPGRYVDPDADLQPAAPARGRGRRARAARVAGHRRRWYRRRPGRHRAPNGHTPRRLRMADALRRWWVRREPRHAAVTDIHQVPLWQPGTCTHTDPHDTWTGGDPR